MSHSICELFNGLHISYKLKEKIIKDFKCLEGIDVIPGDLFLGAAHDQVDDAELLEEADIPHVTITGIRYVDQPSEWIDVYWDVKIQQFPEWDIYIRGYCYETDPETGEIVDCYHEWTTARQAAEEVKKWKQGLNY